MALTDLSEEEEPISILPASQFTARRGVDHGLSKIRRISARSKGTLDVDLGINHLLQLV